MDLSLLNFISLEEHDFAPVKADMFGDFFSIEKGCASHGKHHGKSGACVHHIADDFEIIGMEKANCARHGMHHGKSGACVHHH
mmetsp:Transcript_13826/g.35199  ORF Transcript_13826/g.35199 Transcript_13826/m.35199 type:complete len:83 (+) Transcript_13826:100-348(+)